MINIEKILAHFKELASSSKIQISVAISFGIAIFLFWGQINNELKIPLVILFLFSTCMPSLSLIKKTFLYLNKLKSWKNLTPEEIKFIEYYVINNTKTRYMSCRNGTYKDSGIINPLIDKGIFFLASRTSEYRVQPSGLKEQSLPININDQAFKYFMKKLKKKRTL